IVERARGDRFLGLLDEDRAFGIEGVEPRDGLRRLNMLAGREGAAGHAVDENFDTALAVGGAHPHVVRSALVAECWRHRRMDLEMIAVAEGDQHLAERGPPLV